MVTQNHCRGTRLHPNWDHDGFYHIHTLLFKETGLLFPYASNTSHQQMTLAGSPFVLCRPANQVLRQGATALLPPGEEVRDAETSKRCLTCQIPQRGLTNSFKEFTEFLSCSNSVKFTSSEIYSSPRLTKNNLKCIFLSLLKIGTLQTRAHCPGTKFVYCFHILLT